MKELIKKIIQDWWNDTIYKDWRFTLFDPNMRNRRLDELTDKLDHCLSIKKIFLCSKCATEHTSHMDAVNCCYKIKEGER